jgi:sortase A
MKKITVFVCLVMASATSWNLLQAAYIHGKAELAQQLLNHAWEQTMKHQSTTMKPWAWSDSWPVARLTFPEQHQSFVVLNQGTGRSLAFAPSHLAGSAELGEQGVAVIGGHKDTHFKFLEQVQLQDEIELQLPEQGYVSYRVTHIEIADITQSSIALDAEKPTLALVACYPFTLAESGGPLRYVVVAEAMGEFPVSM